MTELQQLELCSAVPTESDDSDKQEPKPRTIGTAILAFVVGTLFSLSAWILQVWITVCSIIIFGELSRANMWKHILFTIVGSLIIALAWCSSFRGCFGVDNDVKDLGELGFIFGYILSAYLGVGSCHSSDFDKFLPLIIVLWSLLTQLENYRTKVERDKVEETDFLVKNTDIV